MRASSQLTGSLDKSLDIHEKGVLSCGAEGGVAVEEHSLQPRQDDHRIERLLVGQTVEGQVQNFEEPFLII
jgi:small ligand-binding sensory domain FIST